MRRVLRHGLVGVAMAAVFGGIGCSGETAPEEEATDETSEAWVYDNGCKLHAWKPKPAGLPGDMAGDAEIDCPNWQGLTIRVCVAKNDGLDDWYKHGCSNGTAYHWYLNHHSGTVYGQFHYWYRTEVEAWANGHYRSYASGSIWWP